MPERRNNSESEIEISSFWVRNEFNLILVIIGFQLILNFLIREQKSWISIFVTIGYVVIYLISGKAEFLRWFPIYLTFFIYDMLDFILEKVPFDNPINRFRLEHNLFSYNFDKIFLSRFFNDEIPSHFMLNNHVGVFDVFFGVAYLLTIAFLAMFPFYVRIKEPEYFNWVAWSGVLTALITSFLFILLPTPPPWFSFYYGNSIPVGIQIDKNYAAGGLWNLEKIFPSFRITDILFRLSIFNFGSFPSIHIVISSLMYLFLKHMQNKNSRFALGLLVINCFGVVYLAHHYFADVFGGLFMSILIIKIRLIGKSNNVSHIS